MSDSHTVEIGINSHYDTLRREHVVGVILDPVYDQQLLFVTRNADGDAAMAAAINYVRDLRGQEYVRERFPHHAHLLRETT